MIWIQGILGVLLLAGAIFGWVVLHRKVRGEEGPLMSGSKKRNRAGDENELEAFIAAYRTGKIDPTDLESVAAATPATTASRDEPALATALPIPPVAVTAPAPAPKVVSAPAAQPETPPQGVLLRPEVKLAYLTFRSGLRDHHVFPNVRLGDLGHGVAVGTIDLLVCDSGFRYVAAIDVHTGPQPNDPPKLLFLNRAGIRHIYLTSKKMPKPAELRDLVYGSTGS